MKENCLFKIISTVFTKWAHHFSESIPYSKIECSYMHTNTQYRVHTEHGHTYMITEKSCCFVAKLLFYFNSNQYLSCSISIFNISWKTLTCLSAMVCCSMFSFSCTLFLSSYFAISAPLLLFDSLRFSMHARNTRKITIKPQERNQAYRGCRRHHHRRF